VAPLPTPKELHDRAGEAAKETRGTIVKLTTGALGLLIFIATRNLDPLLATPEKLALIVSIVFVVLSLAFAVWFGFADAQWSYWWAVELDPGHRDHAEGGPMKKQWHRRKSRAEKSMLILFVTAGVAMGAFVLLRVLNLGE
jgi:hypothetical protein